MAAILVPASLVFHTKIQFSMCCAIGMVLALVLTSPALGLVAPDLSMDTIPVAYFGGERDHHPQDVPL